MSILVHNIKLYKKVRREFFNNCLWYQIDGHYRESKYFQEALLFYIFNLCGLNPTDKVASMIHQILKSFIFEKPEHRRGVYKEIRYKLLPVLWKHHKAIVRKKQRKLTFLANELDNVGRLVEAHVVRIIVKPYIRDLNKKMVGNDCIGKIKNGTPLLR